jgi:hypothetical protein
LTVEQLSGLLAAGFQVQCPPSWGRAAPSALAWQQVTVYAVLPDAVYRYDAGAHRLDPVTAEQAHTENEAPGALAPVPVQLVYVVDIDPVERAHAEEHGYLAGNDAGCIVENIHRHCEGAGLAEGVCGSFDRHHLARLLGLKPSQRIVLVQAVGQARAPDPAS